MKLDRNTILILVNALLLFCSVSVHSTEKQYDMESIIVMQPKGSGWNEVVSSSQILSLSKSGSRNGESFSAQALVFKTGGLTNSTFSSEMRKSLEKDFPSPGKDLKNLEFHEYSKREYPCVSFSSLEKEIPGKKDDPMITKITQSKYLYCLNPNKEDEGFALIFTFEGENPYSGFTELGESYFTGVKLRDH